MKLKICGMTEICNIDAVLAYPLDYMGFVFYDRSPRNADVSVLNARLKSWDIDVKKVGVFVHKTVEEIQTIHQELDLDVLQLHSNESAAFVRMIREQVECVEIIKVFSISENFDWSVLLKFEGLVDYFLFDTQTSLYGGSGRKFDWSKIQNYYGETPFFLAGGIAVEDIDEVYRLKHPQLYAIDMNSKLEQKPGLKDKKCIEKLFKKIENAKI